MSKYLCKNCGNPINEDDSFCSVCGAKLDSDHKVKPATLFQDKIRFVYLIWCVLLFFMLGFGQHHPQLVTLAIIFLICGWIYFNGYFKRFCEIQNSIIFMQQKDALTNIVEPKPTVQNSKEKRNIHIWCATLLICLSLSISLQYLLLIVFDALLVICGWIVLCSYFKRLFQIKNVEAFTQQQKAEADTYFDVKKKEADAYLFDKHKEADLFYENNVQQVKNTLDSYSSDIEKRKKELQELQEELADLNHTSALAMLDFEIDENITSEEYKNKLSILKHKISDCLKEERALIITSDQNKKYVRNQSKQILRCFDAECNLAIRSVNTRNVDTQRAKINKIFHELNSIFEIDGVKLTLEFLELKLEELNITYAYQLKKAQEKEEQKAIREQMIEEEKARREIEKEKAKLEKEEKQFKNEITKLMGYLQKSTDIGRI